MVEAWQAESQQALSGEDAGPAAVPLPKGRVLNHLATFCAWPAQDTLGHPHFASCQACEDR